MPSVHLIFSINDPHFRPAYHSNQDVVLVGQGGWALNAGLRFQPGMTDIQKVVMCLEELAKELRTACEDQDYLKIGSGREVDSNQKYFKS